MCASPIDAPPSALADFDAFSRLLAGRTPAVFLDYDGTLTPIVPRPDLARLDPATREAVATLAARCPVAVVSGRDLADVRALVGLPGLIYAGSHGFDIAGPHGESLVLQQGTDFLPALAAAADVLTERLASLPGVLIERKRFAITIHYRLAPPGSEAEVAAATEEAATETGLKVTGGKMIRELRPPIPWDKGKAVLWLLEQLDLAGPDVLPLYLGDDATDEDAFRALASRGLGILIETSARPTAAVFRLDGPAEVRPFLERLAALVGE